VGERAVAYPSLLSEFQIENLKKNYSSCVLSSTSRNFMLLFYSKAVLGQND
jgi:hypothetical protein